MPLTVRARRLDAWVDAHPRADDANVKHWLYQHSWIVTGASSAGGTARRHCGS